MIQPGQTDDLDGDVVVTKKGHPLYALTVSRSRMARYKLTDADVSTTRDGVTRRTDLDG
ncbi:hypothetical protein ACFVG1_12980 [Streptomyces bacillaris]|uniref:hypothetical protein n=1 Tax=Streptomyces bacillaris TaxID=68179 RepID=UPI0035DF3A29